MKRNTRATCVDRWSEKGQKIRQEQEKSLNINYGNKENRKNRDSKESEESSKKTTEYLKHTRKMESKVVLNNNMIKYEKLSIEQMSAIYHILASRYYEGIPDKYDVEWKGDIDHKVENMPDSMVDLPNREKKITTSIKEGKQEILKVNLNIKEKVFTIKGTMWKKWEEYEQHLFEELIKEYEELITEFNEMESVERFKDSIKGRGIWKIPESVGQHQLAGKNKKDVQNKAEIKEIKKQKKESKKNEEVECNNTESENKIIECSNNEEKKVT